MQSRQTFSSPSADFRAGDQKQIPLQPVLTHWEIFLSKAHPPTPCGFVLIVSGYFDWVAAYPEPADAFLFLLPQRTGFCKEGNIRVTNCCTADILTA
jgi:hypothetical protein